MLSARPSGNQRFCCMTFLHVFFSEKGDGSSWSEKWLLGVKNGCCFVLHVICFFVKEGDAHLGGVQTN